MTDTPALTGGCLCGAVRYSTTAEPVMAGHCACDNCRAGTGAEHATLFAMPTEALSITGVTSSYSHPGGSGTTITRHFCPTCGSHTLSQNSAMEHLRMVPIGGLDDIARVQPSMFVFHSKKAPWDTAGDKLTTFDTMPPIE